MHKNIPLSLYIHIPWCEKKCPYCDFNSHLKKPEHNETDYINALINDLKQDVANFKEAIDDRPIQTIFIGGGTPSLFSPKSFKRLFTSLQKHIHFADELEITLEANPGSSESEKFNGFREAGINRLSIGIQSFNDSHLKQLGRVHNQKHALEAIEYAKQAGFNNFNLDLMFGLPQQSLSQCMEDIDQAIALEPSHLSCYQLTIEPNTLFHHSPPVTPNDETLWEMQSALQSQLSNANFEQYEVSAYAKNDQHCMHNMNYWRFGDYLGIGAGAHGKITHNDTVQRYSKVKHPTQYLRFGKNASSTNSSSGTDNENSTQIKKLTSSVKTTKKSELAFEFMLNALRLRGGFDMQLFTQRTGLETNHIRTILDKHQQLQLITMEHGKLQTTQKGFQFLNSMLEDYLSM